jgi:hypothetical protein
VNLKLFFALVPWVLSLALLVYVASDVAAVAFNAITALQDALAH